jgi:hypothetical protein
MGGLMSFVTGVPPPEGDWDTKRAFLVPSYAVTITPPDEPVA